MWKYKISFIEIVMILFVLGALSFGFVRSRVIHNSIEHCSIEIKALIIDVYR